MLENFRGLRDWFINACHHTIIPRHEARVNAGLHGWITWHPYVSQSGARIFLSATVRSRAKGARTFLSATVRSRANECRNRRTKMSALPPIGPLVDLRSVFIGYFAYLSSCSCAVPSFSRRVRTAVCTAAPLSEPDWRVTLWAPNPLTPCPWLYAELSRHPVLTTNWASRNIGCRDYWHTHPPNLPYEASLSFRTSVRLPASSPHGLAAHAVAFDS